MSNNICDFKEVSAADLFIKEDAHPATPRTMYYPLRNGDIITVASIGFEYCFGFKVRKVKIGERLEHGFICMKKIKRQKWYKFWEPKYIGVKLMFVEELKND